MDERPRANVVQPHERVLVLRRRAATLVELLVALILAALVLATATSSVLRQQRVHARIRSVSGADAQLRAATLVLAGQLALLDPLAGDLSAGEAADSAVQFRAAIVSSLACITETGSATLLPDTAFLGGMSSRPRVGDSLWWLMDSSWMARRIMTVSSVPASCVSPVSAAGTSLSLQLAAPDTILAGTPLRITRQSRYGVYRASDGTWQLGFREWNDAAHAFSAPQPVAGPLAPPSARGASSFRYFDDGGAELVAVNGAIDVTRVARIRLTAFSLVQVRERSQDSVRADSLDLALHHALGP